MGAPDRAEAQESARAALLLEGSAKDRAGLELAVRDVLGRQSFVVVDMKSTRAAREFAGDGPLDDGAATRLMQNLGAQRLVVVEARAASEEGQLAVSVLVASPGGVERQYASAPGDELTAQVVAIVEEMSAAAPQPAPSRPASDPAPAPDPAGPAPAEDPQPAAPAPAQPTQPASAAGGDAAAPEATAAEDAGEPESRGNVFRYALGGAYAASMTERAPGMLGFTARSLFLMESGFAWSVKLGLLGGSAGGIDIVVFPSITTIGYEVKVDETISIVPNAGGGLLNTFVLGGGQAYSGALSLGAAVLVDTGGINLYAAPDLWIGEGGTSLVFQAGVAL